MSDYRIECATKEEWAERCLLAEKERDRLRAQIPWLQFGVGAALPLSFVSYILHFLG